jgi:hypothetical protein
MIHNNRRSKAETTLKSTDIISKFCKVPIFVIFNYKKENEAVTAANMQSIIFWDMTPCSLVEVLQRFGGTYCLHFHGR